jgi:glycosidase
MAVRIPMDWERVAEQRRDDDSLLAFMSKLLHRRHTTPELGLGTSSLLENEPAALFAHRCDWQDSTVFAVHNLSDEPVAAELDVGEDVSGLDDLLELRDHQVQDGRYRVELDAYGYLWLRARRAS